MIRAVSLLGGVGLLAIGFALGVSYVRGTAGRRIERQRVQEAHRAEVENLEEQIRYWADHPRSEGRDQDS